MPVRCSRGGYKGSTNPFLAPPLHAGASLSVPPITSTTTTTPSPTHSKRVVKFPPLVTPTSKTLRCTKNTPTPTSPTTGPWVSVPTAGFYGPMNADSPSGWMRPKSPSRFTRMSILLHWVFMWTSGPMCKARPRCPSAFIPSCPLGLKHPPHGTVPPRVSCGVLPVSKQAWTTAMPCPRPW